VTKAELTTWALSTGWKLIDGHPSLSKPSRPGDAIMRLVLKATVANVEIRKPSGKWEKVSGAAYGDVTADDDRGMPSGLGLEKLPALSRLIQDNRDAMVFGART
jgi:hypothetical protein